MRTALAMAIVFVAMSALPAHAARPAASGEGGSKAQEREIVALLNQAIAQVYKAAPHCRPANPLERKATLTDADPSADMLNTFAIFRRPGTPEETALVHPERGLPAQGIYRRYARLATSASGRQFVVFAAQNVNFYKPRPARCINAFRRDYAHLIRNRPQAFKRPADKALDQVIRDEWAGKAQPPAEGLFMFSHGPAGGGGGGGGATLAYVKTHGMWGSGQTNHAKPVFSGLVPDGVASIRAHFGTKPRPNPIDTRHHHYKPLTITAAVKDNVVAFTVDRQGFDAWPTSIAWYAADGTKLRTVKFP